MNAWPTEVPPLPAATPSDRPVALLVRHAERPPLAHGDAGLELALTVAGLAQSSALGRVLGPRVRRLSTSPIRRCCETAEALRAGASVSLEIVRDRLLGDPGVFVVEPERAWENWRVHGHDAMLEHLGWRDPPMPGIGAPDVAAHRLAAHLAGGLGDGGPGVDVFVTHDAILLPAVVRLLALPIGDAWWPAYLESAAFWREDGAIRVAYRHIEGKVLP